MGDTKAQMSIGQCNVCRVEGTVSASHPIGIYCACGKHFHVGAKYLSDALPITCPRCDVTVETPFEIDGFKGSNKVEAG